LPFIRSNFNLNYTRSALVLSSFSVTNGISQIPAGWLADRIGPRLLITVGICGVAIAGILVGLSQTFIMMIVFLILMGITCGGYHPAATPMVSSMVEPEKRGRALGIHEVGAGASFFVAPMIAAAIAAAWNWRFSFIGLAVPTLIFGAIFYRIMGRYTRTSQEQQVVAYEDNETSTASGRVHRLVAFITMSVFTGGVLSSAISFVPLYMTDRLYVSEQMASSFLSILYLAGLWASPVGGYISDRVGRIPVVLVVNLVAASAVYLLSLASNTVEIGALLFVLGITVFMRMPVAEAYIMGEASPRNRSTIYGIYYCSMTETGAVLAPLMGFLIEEIDFYKSFAFASIAGVAVTLICALFLRGSKK
jgi:MFS family permease